MRPGRDGRPLRGAGENRLTPLTSGTSGKLSGRIRVPGDKSISHRALLLGALAKGTSRITGLSDGDDVVRTAAAMRAMGAQVDGTSITGGELHEPTHVIDVGNSGTLTIQNSEFSGNSAGFGGGIANSGTLAVYNSSITQNTASQDGGGIYTCCGGTLELENTVVTGNTPNDIVP